MPATKSKKVGTVAPRGPLSKPTIDEIKLILLNHIQTLIDSFAEPNAKNIRKIKSGRDWYPSLAEVRSEKIRREITCLKRAIELLDAIHALDLKELAKALQP